jgi:hypothetical protein
MPNLLSRKLCILLCTLLSFSSHAEADKPIDAATRAEVVDSLARALVTHYIFLDQAQAMATAIRERQQRGEYDKIDDGNVFADKLSENLQEISHDKHLRLEYSIPVLPTAAEEEQQEAREKAKADNRSKVTPVTNVSACRPGMIDYFYSGNTQCLPGNIGYLVLDGFVKKDEIADLIVAAMNRLANTRALIIDVRNNRGGDGDTVALLCSYLFDHAVQFDDAYVRETDHVEHLWTDENVVGKRFGQKKDVYVLVSAHSFSSAELIGYDLQVNKRATIIGEATEGGAHATNGYRIHDHFGARIPFGNTINPITKSNWEGVGVKPDIAVPAYDALNVAQILALRKMMKSDKDSKRLTQLRTRLQALRSEMIGHESMEASR